MSSYIGDNPFLFFSYCHADREEVFRIADAVDKAGYRVWYDKAISGAELDDKTAERISASRIFILFLSKSYLRMPHCDMGMKHAMNYNCTCFAVYLEDVDLSRKAALEMGLRPANNLYKFKMPEEEFLQKLCSSSLLQECKYDKNEPHDGVVLQEEPIKRAPLEYGLLGYSAGFPVFLQLFPLTARGKPLSMHHHPQFSSLHHGAVASVPFLRHAPAAAGTRRNCSSGVCRRSLLHRPFFAADSCDKRQKVAAQRRQQFSAMLHRPHSLPVPHAVHVRLPISLGSMRTVLSHLRRAARNVWTNLQRTGAKRTPQLCDSGGLRASHASLRCHRIRSPLPRL